MQTSKLSVCVCYEIEKKIKLTTWLIDDNDDVDIGVTKSVFFIVEMLFLIGPICLLFKFMLFKAKFSVELVVCPSFGKLARTSNGTANL